MNHLTPSPTIAQTIAHWRAQGLDRLDTQLLLLHVLNQPAHHRAWLLSHDTDVVDAPTLQRLATLATRRLQGEPLAYLTGHKEFYGLDLQVDARVLVPRPDTETLVDWALEVLALNAQHYARSAPTKHDKQVLDLGTGSGAIALALKQMRPEVLVSAIDFSEDALAVATANAKRLRLDVHFSQGSWLTGVQLQYDVIVSNPPYIAAQDEHLTALTHEPIQALASGADGLDDLRLIIQQAPRCLQPGAWLLLEHGYDQAPAVRRLLIEAGFSDVQSRCDLSRIERCSGGRLMHQTVL
jgi:release factor glutamine methyltransferase